MVSNVNPMFFDDTALFVNENLRLVCEKALFPNDNLMFVDENALVPHWESIVLKSAIHETKIRTTNGREKQGCKGYFGFHNRVGYMRETYLMSTPLGRM